MQVSLESNLKSTIKEIGSILSSAVEDVFDYGKDSFLTRTVGSTDAYVEVEKIMASIGREPMSILVKEFPFIHDHVWRNFEQGTAITRLPYGMSPDSPIPSTSKNPYYKFTFYKERPKIRFADPYEDINLLIDRWLPSINLNVTRLDRSDLLYAESLDDKPGNISISNVEGNGGTSSGQRVYSIEGSDSSDIIRKTNDNFKLGKYRTLVARFHTDSDDSKDFKNPTQTAISHTYGMSHGRNLLKLNPSIENSYTNPYCRVWTYHHQYNQMSRAIRPFDTPTAEGLESEMMGSNYKKGGFRTLAKDYYKVSSGSERLDKHGVLNYENGFVNIAPTAKLKHYFNGKQDDKSEKAVSIKRCMFSIENLAWKGGDTKLRNEFNPNGLSPEQKGPFGGRIMWFPPYDLTFSEQTQANWNGNEFIGRGEKIYTYTNTDRTGNLSFTLLIDHPSVVDYWVDRKNNNFSTGDVDDKSSAENKLLRFFAGCEILKAEPQFYETKVENKIQKQDPSPNPPAPAVTPDPPATEETPPPGKKRIVCVLYYPNNYSGVDDFPTDPNSKVNAIYYLMNGIGTQKHVMPSACKTCKHVFFPTAEELEESKKHGNKLLCPNENCPDHKAGERKVEKSLQPENITLLDLDRICRNGKDSGATHPNRGYEINNNISITEDNLEADYDTIKKSFADPVTSEKCAQYLTDKDGNFYTAYYGEEEFRLAKIVGSSAMTLTQAKNSTNLTGKPHLWYRRRWYYRVDEAYENSQLSEKEAMIDTCSLNLNGSGYTKIKDENWKNFRDAIDLKDDDTLISFADLFVALEGEDAKKVIDEGQIDGDNVGLINGLVKDKDRYKFNVTFTGHASFQGHDNFNDALSKHRWETLKKWMQKNNFPGVDESSGGAVKTEGKAQSNFGQNSTDKAKIWRSASVVIEYGEEKEEPAQVVDTESQEVTLSPDTSEETEVVVDNENSEQSEPNRRARKVRGDNEQDGETKKKTWASIVNTISQTVRGVIEGGSKFNDDAYILYEKKSGDGSPESSIVDDIYEINKVLSDGTGHRRRDDVYYHPNGGDGENINTASVNVPGNTSSSTIGKTPTNNALGNNANNGETIKSSTPNKNTVERKPVERYDNEGEFFELLEKNDPFMHHLISQKIRYFDPAFHSISPEGFNARLTFLHQCTRQGPTIGGSDINKLSAYNLAFGRPPVCILRIGDFFYTKIIIDSVQINYDQVQWDLNPEGIGVMPMFAKVTLTFKFVGGSDLSGPIARLQNAVSFNYYANTGVYDNRAEMVEFENNGSGRETAFKPFIYSTYEGTEEGEQIKQDEKQEAQDSENNVLGEPTVPIPSEEDDFGTYLAFNQQGNSVVFKEKRYQTGD